MVSYLLSRKSRCQGGYKTALPYSVNLGLTSIRAFGLRWPSKQRNIALAYLDYSPVVVLRVRSRLLH